MTDIATEQTDALTSRFTAINARLDTIAAMCDATLATLDLVLAHYGICGSCGLPFAECEDSGSQVTDAIGMV